MRLLPLLLDLFFPPRCVLCRRRPDNGDQADFCVACLVAMPDPACCCRRCGYVLPGRGAKCQACRGLRLAFTGTCAADLYRGRLKTVIHRYKYGGQMHLAGPLGRLLARQIRRCPWPAFSAVVPVPLHPRRLSDRGYDQSLLLAQVIGTELDVPLKVALVRTRSTKSQTRLGSAERWENMQEAFTGVPGTALSGNILLVDDLLTTGATAHYAAEALLNAGASAVYLAVIGR